MSAFKAIETSYKGYRFRSRVEARWAVFFDMMEWEWEYEKEGFDLDGIQYLPDFFLSRFGMWVEIKGAAPDEDEIVKGIRLEQLTKQSVLFLFGEPWPDKHGALFLVGGEPSGGSMVHFVRCELCQQDESVAFNDGQRMRLGAECTCSRGDYRRVAMDAYSAARSARFEHGESGHAEALVALRTQKPLIRHPPPHPIRPEIELMARELEEINRKLPGANQEESIRLKARRTDLLDEFIEASPMA